MTVYQVLALALLAVFYGCYFGKMLRQKRQGIRTDQIGRGKTGFVRRVEITMKIATILTPVAELVSIFCNASAFPAWVRMIGAAIAALGTAAFIASVVTMRDSWRAGVSPTDKTELVTRGVYQISRNPAFLGFDLVYLGVALMFANWPLWLVSCFAAAMFHLQIVNVEEDFLIESFGEQYLDYRRHVNRYFGKKRHG